LDILDYDTYPGWPRFPAFSRFIDFTLIDSTAQTAAPAAWLNPGWNWFSIPLDPVGSPEASALLGQNVQNILYRWDAGRKTVELYPSDFVNLEAGIGYVLRLGQDLAPAYAGYPRLSAPAIPIPEAGWTWIGLPKDAPVALAGMSVRNELTREVRTCAQDYESPVPWLNWNWLYWDSARDSVSLCAPFGPAEDHDLRPWYGYRVWSNVGDLKIITP
jgi:hypothetical protein